VFAMSGGALAASRYLITSTKQINPKVLKSLKGNSGAPGAPGATGAAGPQGSQGPQGATGPAGATGATGATGAAGKAGVAGSSGPAGPPGPRELKAGESETGLWSATDHGFTEESEAPFAISFPIAVPSTSSKAFYFNKEQTENEEFGTSGCTGSAQPTAPEGTLCVFTQEENNENSSFFFFHAPPGASGELSPNGTFIVFHTAGPGSVRVFGTWVVTAQ
jgi:hypothetical protein